MDKLKYFFQHVDCGHRWIRFYTKVKYYLRYNEPIVCPNCRKAVGVFNVKLNGRLVVNARQY